MDLEARKEKIRLAVRDLPEAVRQGIIHPDYRHSDPVLPEELQSTMTSAQAYADGAVAFWKSFPDLQAEIVWMVVEGDKSATRWRNRGTFTGEPFYGSPANGKPIDFSGLTMWRWENEQVVEGMTLFDNATFNAQIGA